MVTPLTGQSQAALMCLYDQARRTTDNFTLERIDRAADEIVRVNSADPPTWQVRSAMANASKVLVDRRRTVSPATLEVLAVDVAALGDDQDVIIELLLWLHRTPYLTERERRVLKLLADDNDAASIAALLHVSVPRMREQVSRARRAARLAYEKDVIAA